MNSIRFVKKNRTYNAYLDDEYLGAVYSSELDKLGVDISEEYEFYAELSDQDVYFIRDKVYNRAFNKAYGYLTANECSENVIRHKLKMKQFPEQTIDDVIEMLYEYNYLDEARFVESFTRSYIRSKSRSLIERELGNRDIDASQYKDVIDRVYMDENLSEDDVIKLLLEKKYKNQNLEDIKVKRRALSYLFRHGFTYDKINNYLT